MKLELLVHKYQLSVERELSASLKKQSLSYWLHLYRRISPESIGSNKAPATIGEVRATLEAAFQKYAQLEPCNRIGITGEIPINRVLGGILMGSDFEPERMILNSGKQMVLTDFTSVEMREFIEIERLAYEIWYSNAMLRIIGKGAPLVVDNTMEATVFDNRTDELDFLVRSFDGRGKGWDYWLLSSTGMVSDFFEKSQLKPGFVFLPIYNISHIPLREFNTYFKTFDIGISSSSPDMFTNFVWLPFDIRSYKEAHAEFAGPFLDKYGLSLDAVLLVIAALCYRVFLLWIRTRGESIIRYWQRAYEGPNLRGDVISEIQQIVQTTADHLDLDCSAVTSNEITDAINFWSLNEKERKNIDLTYTGPHKVLLPYSKDRIFIDYSWIYDNLYYLFVGIKLSNQNFKGDALEHMIQVGVMVLPVKGCKTKEGKTKQVDASFKVGNRLVIVECRAVGKAISFLHGDPNAIGYRNRVIDGALIDIDSKANWLREHPIGSNYDISEFVDILPIVVTPFVEYINNKNTHYWLTEKLPRVVTPNELKRALREGLFEKVTQNLVSLTPEN